MPFWKKKPMDEETRKMVDTGLVDRRQVETWFKLNDKLLEKGSLSIPDEEYYLKLEPWILSAMLEAGLIEEVPEGEDWFGKKPKYTYGGERDEEIVKEERWQHSSYMRPTTGLKTVRKALKKFLGMA